MKKKQTLGTFISKNIIYIAFVIMLIGLSVFTSSFLQMKNLVNVLRQATVVGVLSMGITKGTRVSIIAEGPDEEEAVKALTDMLVKEVF